MHGNENHFLEQISPFLGSYFLCLAIMNAIAAFYCWKQLNNSRLALTWLLLGFVLLIMSPFGYAGMNGAPSTMKFIGVPEVIKNFVDSQLANAVAYTVGTTLGLVILYWQRKFFVKPVVAWIIFNLMLIVMAFLGGSKGPSMVGELRDKICEVPVQDLMKGDGMTKFSNSLVYGVTGNEFGHAISAQLLHKGSVRDIRRNIEQRLLAYSCPYEVMEEKTVEDEVVLRGKVDAFLSRKAENKVYVLLIDANLFSVLPIEPLAQR